jgi:hypothetical protein
MSPAQRKHIKMVHNVLNVTKSVLTVPPNQISVLLALFKIKFYIRTK